MKFNVGDKVSFLNEKLDGVVTKILGKTKLEVTTDDGFGFPVLASELILVKAAEKAAVESKEEKINKPKQDRGVSNEKLGDPDREDVFAPIKKIKKEKKVLGREEIRRVLQEKMQTKVVGKISLKHSHRRKDVEGEVDLHIEQLLDSWKHMSNGEIVLHQLSVAREKIDEAILAGKHRLVLIHGVGNGRLKTEVRKLVKSYPGLRYEDGHFSVYGAGATLVHL